jgi:molybdopterin converting factor small subunit
MARVVLTPALARRFAGGHTDHDVPGGSVRHVVRALDARYPGIAGQLDEDGVAVVIDGVLHHNAMLEDVAPDSEVCFIPAITGG